MAAEFYTGIDAHHHCWVYSPDAYPWMGPQHAPIMRSFGVSDLAPSLSAAGLRGSIAVQARQSLEENAYLLALADAHPSILGVVGWVDLCAPGEVLSAQLAAFAAHPRACGVRHVLHDEADDLFCLRPAFRRGISALAAHDLAYDILIFPKHLAPALELVKEFPLQRFVVDHAGNPAVAPGGGEPDVAWLEGMRALAAQPNVFCKLGGMVTKHAKWHGWVATDFYRNLDALLACFGPQRLLYGSDWPVCLLAATYEGQHGIVAEWAKSRLSAEDYGAVMGGNAARFYKLG